MVLPPPPGVRKVRKQLSADALYALLREGFARIPDHRQPKPPIPLRDALLSAFAMFSLKDPSLLAFDQRRSDANLKALFGIGQIPSDTQTREILDPLDPEHLRPVFDDVFRPLQRCKALEPFADQVIQRVGRQVLANLPGIARRTEDHGDSFRLDRGPSSLTERPQDNRSRPTKKRLFTVRLYEKTAHSPPIFPAIPHRRELLKRM